MLHDPERVSGRAQVVYIACLALELGGKLGKVARKAPKSMLQECENGFFCVGRLLKWVRYTGQTLQSESGAPMHVHDV